MTCTYNDVVIKIIMYFKHNTGCVHISYIIYFLYYYSKYVEFVY